MSRLGRFGDKQLLLLRSIERRWRGLPSATEQQTPIRYGQDLRLMLIVMVALSVLEILAGILLIPWRWLELLVTISGFLALIWVYGFICAVRTRPHVLDSDVLLLRFAHSHEIRVPLTAVVGVGAHARSDYQKTMQIEPSSIALTAVGSTNLVLRLQAGSAVQVFNHRAGDPVTIIVDRVLFAADHPRDAIRAIQNVIPDRINS